MLRRSLRAMEPRDIPRLLRITAAQNRRDGTSYPFPAVFNLQTGELLPNVLLALVTEVNGRVRQGHVWLRTIEQMDFGGGRADTEFAIAHMPLILDSLRRRGYADEHIFVPKVRVEDFAGLLAEQGMQRVDTRLAHYFRMLGEDTPPKREE